MESVLASVTEYLVAFIVVFVILFVLVAYFFTGKKLMDTIRGFFLVVASLFYSPFMYFRKSLLAVAHFRLKEATENEEGRQYLLIRFLTLLQALLAIIVVGMFVSGLITAWNAFLPPKYVREQNARLDKELTTLQTEFAKLNPDVSAMETSWTNSRQQLIETYRKEQEARVSTVVTNNTSIEQQITNANANQYFFPIKRYLDQNQYQSSIRRYDNIKREALDYIRNQDAPSEAKQLTNSFIENWHTLMTIKFEQSNFTDDQYRTKIQPDYSSEKAELSNVERQIEYAKEQVKNLEPAMKYNLGTSFLLLLGTLLTVLLVIWSVGLAIELLWLSVDIAENVNKIRSLKQNI